MNATPPGRVNLLYRVHWHVVVTHFPLSFFLASGLFMFLHLFGESACFELASTVCLAIGAAATPFAIATGWATWKARYRGARTPLFDKKIVVSFAMLALSVALLAWRLFLHPEFHFEWHAVYALALFALLGGAAAEGMLGGRLNHR